MANSFDATKFKKSNSSIFGELLFYYEDFINAFAIRHPQIRHSLISIIQLLFQLHITPRSKWNNQ